MEAVVAEEDHLDEAVLGVLEQRLRGERDGVLGRGWGRLQILQAVRRVEGGGGGRRRGGGGGNGGGVEVSRGG